MAMPGRTFSATTQYRYGFNGKENDRNISDGAQDYGMRINDARLGRFLSMDPLINDYPYYTPYQFAGNTPIQAIDLDGSEPQKKGVINLSSYDDIIEHPIRSALQNTSYAFATAFGINFIDDLSADLTDGIKGNKTWKEAGNGMLQTTEGIFQSMSTGEPNFLPPPSADASLVLQTEKGMIPLAATTNASYLTIPTYATVLSKATSNKGGKDPNYIGKKGEQKTGMDKPGEKQKFDGASGVEREADKMTKTTVHETKNVAYQHLSTQIKDYIAYAAKEGKKFFLWIRQDTKISKQLQDEINKGTVRRKTIPK